jgi:hypothetical protein
MSNSSSTDNDEAAYIMYQADQHARSTADALVGAMCRVLNVDTVPYPSMLTDFTSLLDELLLQIGVPREELMRGNKLDILRTALRLVGDP